MLTELFDGNPYFTAGFGLTIMATGLALARRGAMDAFTLAKRHLLLTMEVTSRDRAYPWVLHMLKQQSKGRLQHLTLNTVMGQSEASKTMTARFEFTPRPGRHILTYKNRWLFVERTRDAKAVSLQDASPFETVTIKTVGTHRDLWLFDSFLSEAKLAATAHDDGKTVVYRNWGPEWRPFGFPRIRRPLSSVILHGTIAEDTLADVKEFLDSAAWYVDRGIPYRRGYLLYGAPGSGKTSFITALAGELRYNICTLNLNEHGLTDDRLQHAVAHMPPMSVLLLEDVDAAFDQREGDRQKLSHVTFSGLLNTLDGVTAGEERLVFMTTNHRDRLDPALIRPGRVDVMLELGNASEAQCASMYAKFYPGAATEDAAKFAAVLSGSEVSMAALQGFFLLYKDKPAQALAAAPQLLDTLRR